MYPINVYNCVINKNVNKILKKKTIETQFIKTKESINGDFRQTPIFQESGLGGGVMNASL
jgi:hypothetical protein